jgi:sigma-E factor negative regulatory protein RseA
MNEELDSQLSAMFDDELPPAECELLARRLSRDEQLKARWGRYAVIGAAIRAEHDVRLDARLPQRVKAAISAEPALAAAPAAKRSARLLSKWWQPVAGLAVAASVAAVAILWLRAQSVPGLSEPTPGQPSAGQAALTQTAARSRAPDNATTGEPDSYVVPQTPERRVVVPTTELANYVVAHSEFSSPVTRRNLLSSLVSNDNNEAGTGGASPGSDEPTEDVQDDAKNNTH